MVKFGDIPQFIEAGEYQINMPISHIKKWLEETEKDLGIDLNPDFQRGYVWTEEQQIAYMEFLFKGGITGRVIYFNCPTWSGNTNVEYPLQCVDGLQRLTAILAFLDDKIKVFGQLYSEYSGKVPTRFDVLININSLQTRREVLEWYLQFNSGGTIHSEEELNRVRKLLEEEK